MKKPTIARQRVTVTHERPVENPGSEMDGQVESWTESFFVYEGEPGVDLAARTVAAGEDHKFVQQSNGVLTAFGADQLQLLLKILEWDFRELGRRAGVNAGACRDAVLRSSSCTNTYPKMLQAIRVGLDVKGRMESAKQKEDPPGAAQGKERRLGLVQDKAPACRLRARRQQVGCRAG